jgi:hypothetical protein
VAPLSTRTLKVDLFPLRRIGASVEVGAVSARLKPVPFHKTRWISWVPRFRDSVVRKHQLLR